MKVQIKISELFDLIEKFNSQTFLDNTEQDISNLGIQINTPQGLQPVNWAIKKNQLTTVDIQLSDNHTLGCSDHHTLYKNQEEILAKDLIIGDTITTQTGNQIITNITPTGKRDCYDIGIPTPNMYYDSYGILHHNTIITAALSTACEQYGRTIVIVPSKSLVTQTEADYVNLAMDVGVFYGERKDLGKTHTISTWQSLSSLAKNSVDADDDEYTIRDMLDGVVAVIVDECLSGDTKVLTPSGYVPIKTLKSGDTIINYSEETKLFKNDTVVKLHTNLMNSQSEDMYELEFDNGEKIEVTGNHKFLTNNGWIRADELTELDEIISLNK